ncbi:adenosylcobinamide-phosphate synthase CbiB [Bacillus solitudinis]|uniref:adenosylcobinamide-phosphate synthase CbiB n=1 Tax=Bacillus solitudinis TaxID=2014074 RepID=UPI000C23EDCE|nr:adenosylcobinamide-phosphate synthase CbiB [Bacillus solitudinis]
MIYHLIALTMGVVIDRIMGDPKWLPHPVIGMGKLIATLDQSLNRGRKKRNGFVLLIVVSTVVLVLAIAVTLIAYRIHLYIGIFIEAFLISTTIAQKGLKLAATQVAKPLEQGEIEKARTYLSYIVGRDTARLDEAACTRGTVETVAENTSDGVTAPLFFALLGGAPFALVYRAVNTCDSMVGYKSEKYEQFGFASAKFDDILNWIPSRITGSIMIIMNKPSLQRTRRDCWRIMKRDAPKHPSPNSGWGEAAVAALLGIQLGGINTYKGTVSDRARMGDALVSLGAEHIYKTNAIMGRTVIGFMFFLWLIGGVFIVFT